MVDSGWGAVLDDLATRVAAAEEGDLAALEGWAPPAEPAVMTGEDHHRAIGVLSRQRALLGRLLDERAEVTSALAALRRPAMRPTAVAAPVYLDRTG